MSAASGTASRGLDVLALLSDGSGGGGGIAAYNRELLGALSGHRHHRHTTVLPRNAAPPRGVPADVEELPAPASRAGYLGAALSLGLRRRFDWLFCGHLNLAPAARVVAATCGARLWLQLHGVEAWEAPGRAVRAAVRGAALVTAVSRFTRQRFLDWAALHPGRVRVLPNTVDPVFAPGPADPTLRARLSPRGAPVILTVSRLDSRERYKGHDLVIRALALEPLAGAPAPIYVVAGEGDDRPRLESLARELGVAERVLFLGAVSQQALPALYRSAEVFAMPSRGEGFGIVFLEAAASGLPVLAGDADGARDALRDGAVGRLVAATDPQAIAAGLADIIRHGEVPGDIAVFRRDAFRDHLWRVLTDCPPVESGERWR